MQTYIKPIQKVNLKNKRVLVRVDFNVPLTEISPKEWEVADLTRIEGALPTIQYILEQGGKCILASHLGRPEGKRSSKYSMIPVGLALSKLLNKEVIVTEDCVGDGPKNLAKNLTSQEVLLLENLRFYPEEEANSETFAQELVDLCDVYVSDAFGTLHRAHASTYAAPKLAPVKVMGLLVQKELEFLAPLQSQPKKPFYLVMGGSKVSDKIKVIEKFLEKVDGIFVGGAMAYAFLKAKGVEIGKSKCDEKQVALAAQLLIAADARKIPIYLPVDHRVVPSIEAVDSVRTTSGEDIPKDCLGVDVGPKTIETFFKVLMNAETVFWNGPMGIFEVEAFSKGTFELARKIALLSAKKLVGGGDSAAAIQKARVEDKFDFISTGGGATLEYLEGNELPGLKALEIPVRAVENESEIA